MIHFPLPIKLIGIAMLVLPIARTSLFAGTYRPLKEGGFLILMPIVALVALAIYRECSKWKWNLVAIIFLVFLLWVTLSISWATNRFHASMEVAFWWAAAFLYGTLRQLRPSKKQIAFLVGCYLTSWSVNLAHGLLYHWGFHNEPGSFLGHPNYSAQTTAVALVILLAILIATRIQWQRWLAGILFGLGLLWFYYLGSRASWLGFIFASVGMLSYFLARRWSAEKSRRLKRIVIGGAFIGLIGIWGALVQLHGDKGWKEFEGSVSLRGSIYLNTLMMIKDRPIVGVGAGNFRENYPPYQMIFGAEYVHTKSMLRTPHNEYLRICCETGLVGLVSFLMWLFFVFRYPAESFFENAIKMMLLAILINSLFSFPLKHPQILLPFFTGVALLSNGHPPLSWQPRPWLGIASRYAIVGVAVIVFCLGSSHLATRYLERQINFWQRQPDQVYLTQWAALTVMFLAPDYTKAYNRQIRVLLRKRRYREALFFSERLLSFHPNHWTYLGFKARALDGLGRDQEAKQVREHIHRLLPEKYAKKM